MPKNAPASKMAATQVNVFSAALVASILLVVYVGLNLSLSGVHPGQYRDVMIGLVLVPLVFVYLAKPERRMHHLQLLSVTVLVASFLTPIHSLLIGGSVHVGMVFHPALGIFSFAVIRYLVNRWKACIVDKEEQNAP